MKVIQVKQKTSGGYEELYPIGISGSTLKLQYDASFSGKAFTVTSGGATVYSGTFETFSSGTKTAIIPLEKNSTTYDIASDGVTTQVTTDQYYKELSGIIAHFQATINVTYPSGSSCTCTHTDGTKITASTTTGTYSFVVGKTGNWTVKCTSGSQSAQEVVNITTQGQTVNVSLAYISTTFNNNSWATIKSAVNAGTAASYWKVGDRKAVVLNGTVGVKSFSNTTTYCYILGFDHNKTTESGGAHALHIGFGASALSGGAYIAYCDSNYPNQVSTSCFNMNTSNTNSGGWNSCQMKSTICPAFKNALPSDLKSNIRAVTKWQNDGNSTNAQSSSNEIWLLSEMEIFGSAQHSGYTANQLQYDFYKGVTNWSAAPKIKYKDTSTSNAAFWWERSARSSASGYFCGVSASGNADRVSADGSYGFAPCLCL